MLNARFYELNHHLPKLQLLEIFPLAPFLGDRTDMITFDVGANMGLWSEGFLKAYGAQISHHHMFEPLHGNQELLDRRNENILSRLTPNLHVHKVAVGPEDGGEVELNFDIANSTLASIVNTQSIVGQKTVSLSNKSIVPQISLDAEIERQGVAQVDFLKIDVEGYEMPVLMGAQEAMRAGRIRVILFEFGGHQAAKGEDFKDFYDLLTLHGYQVYKAQRARNFFGFAPVESYYSELEPIDKSVEMVLASLDPVSPNFRGPRVIGGPLRRPKSMPGSRWFQ
jgi:FkbM family methyltransferase